MQVPVEDEKAQVRKEEEKQKIQRQREQIKLAQEGDKTVRDKFVIENMGLVYHVARRFTNRGYELEDLSQIGSIGLIKAVQNFNTDYEVCFSTYAVYLIQGEIRRFLRDDGPIKVSRTLKENGARISKSKEKLTLELGREPTLQELAEDTLIQKEDIVLALEANAEMDSIDRDNFAASRISESDMNGVSDNDRVLNKLVLQQMIDTLSENDKLLILLRYQNGLTQTEVGNRLNMTQVQISRREKKILSQFKKNLE